MKIVVLTEIKMYQVSLKLSGNFRVRKANVAHKRRRIQLKDRGITKFIKEMSHRSSTSFSASTGCVSFALVGFNMKVPTAIKT